ncbi:MAG: TetR/AcrR family transcriptional regulator [Gemmatimonadaceae bacterium]|nr:TetR/AcrR family transcriptional regulator [Gemmatimonadaceae bacterium]
MHKSRLLTPTPPQQARSRETQEALLAAAEHVFAEVGIAQATVSEICERAGVAVGTFYGRFPDKDALLLFWYERFFKRGRVTFDRAFSDAMWDGRPAAEVIRGWVQSRVLHYRKNRKLLKALLLYVRGRPAPEFKPYAAQLQLPALQRLSALLEARRAEWRHADPLHAIPMAVVMMESTVQSVILFNDHRGDEPQVTDDELVDHLTGAMRAYLQVA